MNLIFNVLKSLKFVQLAFGKIQIADIAIVKYFIFIYLFPLKKTIITGEAQCDSVYNRSNYFIIFLLRLQIIFNAVILNSSVSHKISLLHPQLN